MTTAALTRVGVYDYLYGAYPKDRPFETLLNEPLDNSETDVDVLAGTDWARGDILEIAETGEECLVLSVATNTLTVKRSYGSVAATAAADQGIIRKNPRWAQSKVDRFVTQALNGLSAWGIHGFEVGSYTLAASTYYFENTETDIDYANGGVLAVYYVDDSTAEPTFLPFRPSHELSSADADWSQGRGVTILNKGDRDTTDPVYYTYAQNYSLDTDLDTTLAKLAVEQEELVVLGAVVRLMGATIAPATQDPGNRTQRTVAPGQTGRDGRWFQGEFFIKARAEAARLAVEKQRIAGGSARTKRVGRWVS